MNKLHKPFSDSKNPHAAYVKIVDILDVVVLEYKYYISFILESLI